MITPWLVMLPASCQIIYIDVHGDSRTNIDVRHPGQSLSMIADASGGGGGIFDSSMGACAELCDQSKTVPQA